MILARPYLAAFSARFILMLQYRAAAIAGFTTQLWWGGTKIMVYAAFYRAAPAAAANAISLQQVVTYTWLAQGLLALSPWACDPDVAAAVRTGAIASDRLRPVSTYALWYVRAVAWMTSRAVPRVLLMFVLAGVVLPIVGLDAWAWAPPADAAHAMLFALSLALAVALSASMVMLLNLAVVVTLDARGVNTVVAPFVVALSGSLIPLALLPDWMSTALFIQPFAGLIDIPFRIYTANLSIEASWLGIAVQSAWTLAFTVVGRLAMGRVMDRLEVNGG